jgi:hypothetical protein
VSTGIEEWDLVSKSVLIPGFSLTLYSMAYIILIRSIRLSQGIIQAHDSPPPSHSTSTIQSLRNLLSTLVPFLFDPKSTWKAKGLREVEEEVFGGFEDVEMVSPRQLRRSWRYEN